jgi:hypothetical protein
MYAIMAIVGVLLGSAASVAGKVPISLVNQKLGPPQLQIYNEIANRITAEIRARNLPALEALGQEIEQNWRQADVQLYAHCMFKLSSELGGQGFPGTRKNYGLGRTLAIRALEKADEIPLELECMLVDCVRFDLDSDGNIVKGQTRADQLAPILKLSLHAWRRVEQSIDPTWDPDDPKNRPFLNPPPLEGVRDGGASADALNDPQVRAQYEAAIEANRRKIWNANEQLKARKLKQYWVPWAQRRILYAYMEQPARKAELEELLLQYEIPAETRVRMLQGVETGQMPEHLILRNTTQPSDPGAP